jgi:uncharacterized protein with FMN-binding domain
MRRAPIVLAATVAGVAAVLSFHTKSAQLTLGSPTRAAAPMAPPTTSVASGPPPHTPTTAVPTTAAPTTKTAAGVAVNYNYGILSVQATVSGGRLTNVTIASIDDGGNFRSQSIDQQSIPILEQQALQAQSARIQGVSGASYTSAGFEQSLQSALTQLGF